MLSAELLQDFTQTLVILARMSVTLPEGHPHLRRAVVLAQGTANELLTEILGRDPTREEVASLLKGGELMSGEKVAHYLKIAKLMSSKTS